MRKTQCEQACRRADSAYHGKTDSSSLVPPYHLDGYFNRLNYGFNTAVNQQLCCGDMGLVVSQYVLITDLNFLLSRHAVRACWYQLRYHNHQLQLLSARSYLSAPRCCLLLSPGPSAQSHISGFAPISSNCVSAVLLSST